MALSRFVIVPSLVGGFFFSFASKCMPTFFSVFLSTQGYTTRDIILISSIFFLGSFIIKYNFFKNKISVKVFQIAAALGTIVLHIQGHVNMVFGWFFIRFIQGIIDILCRNALNNLTQDRYLGQLAFFMNLGSSMGFFLLCYPKSFLFLFTITGVLLNLSLISVTFQPEGEEYNQIISIQQDKVLTNWYKVLRENRLLFVSFLLSTLLTSTFSTIFPIALRNNGFSSPTILKIMFVGSLGQTFIQTFSMYLRNMIGSMFYIRMLIKCLIVLHILLLFTIKQLNWATSFVVFFVIGFHYGITEAVMSIFREYMSVSSRLIRHGVNQVTHIGSILGAIISLVFLTKSPKYGLFILWVLALLLLTICIRSFKVHKKIEK